MCNNVTRVEPLVFSLTVVRSRQTNMNIKCIGLTLKIILRIFDFFINLSTQHNLVNKFRKFNNFSLSVAGFFFVTDQHYLQTSGYNIYAEGRGLRLG